MRGTQNDRVGGTKEHLRTQNEYFILENCRKPLLDTLQIVFESPMTD